MSVQTFIPLLRMRQAAAESIALLLLVCAAFTAGGSPAITHVSPASGPPGTSVAISGLDLRSIQEVRFGTLPSIFTIASDFLIFATVPLEAVSAPLSVSGPTGVFATRGEFLVSPRISRLEPDRAPPGAIILIEGSNFEGAGLVQFNGTNAAFLVTSETQIQAQVPPGATSGPVTVETAVGLATSAQSFTVSGQDPFVTKFSPALGKPGDPVVIEGVNFGGLRTVAFGGTNAFFTVTSASQLTAQVPNGAPSGPISVGNSFGTNSSAASFLVTTAPVITDFQPIGGGPGTPVVINGANFLGLTDVRIGGQSAKPFAVTAATQLHATVPSGTTNGLITITTPNGTGVSDEPFLATSNPIISDFSPRNGPPGTIVVLNGLNFTNVVSVKVGGVSASASLPALTQLAVTVPAGATSGPITLTAASGATTSTTPFLVQNGTPVIVSISPQAGVQGAVVRIDGLDLSGATAVGFNGIVSPSFQVVAATQISAVVPENAVSGPITVFTRAGAGTSAVSFFVAPTLTSISPATGAAGTPVVIQGSNLADITLVRFVEVPAQFSRQSTNQLIAVVPDEATTGSINVISPAGIVATTNLFLVLPGVSRFTPTAGQPGTEVEIFGTGFSDVTGVTFANTPATDFAVISSTQIAALVPARAVTGPISVSTFAGTGTSTRSFTVGTAADLVLSADQSTNALLQNQIWTYSLTVTNQGPSAASSVVLTNSFPEALAIKSAIATQGTLTGNGSQFRLGLGILPVGGIASLTVTGLLTAVGPLTNTASVSALETDPDLANNFVAQAAVVATNPAVLQITSPAPATVRASWPIAATNFVLQSTQSLSPAIAWQIVAGTPQVVGSQLVLTLPASGQRRYFRLIRP